MTGRLATTLVVLVVGASALVSTQGGDEGWLSWSAQQAEAIGKLAYVKGRVGGWWDTRLLKTERSYNYKLAATWMTPDVIRATARLEQLTRRLDPAATKKLVEDAEVPSRTVVMVEIDPREGAGIVPDDWSAFLQFDAGTPVPGTVMPNGRDVKALAGVLRRNYDYDRFWVSFPLAGADGRAAVPADALQATLIVRIYEKEGHVEWRVPSAFREQVRGLAAGGK